MSGTCRLRFAAWAGLGLGWAWGLPNSLASPPSLPDWVVQASAALLPQYPPETKAVVLLDDTLVSIGTDGKATERERRVVKILSASRSRVRCDRRPVLQRRET